MSTPEKATPTRWEHSPRTWKKRLQFVDVLGQACASQSVSLVWLDEEKWTGSMRSQQGNHASIYGYDLGLNTSASAKVADSKTDTYVHLTLHNVPAIRHERIAPHFTDGSRPDPQTLAKQAITRIGLPMVLKPDAGHSSGKGVELCRTHNDVVAYMQEANSSQRPSAASPFTQFDEYRVVVLDGQARGVIQKHLAPTGWMHNQSKGSGRTLLDKNHELHAPIGALGIAAAKALDLCFTTVDVAHIVDANNLAVLEANDAVSMVYPSTSEIGQLATEVYADAIALRLSN